MTQLRLTLADSLRAAADFIEAHPGAGKISSVWLYLGHASEPHELFHLEAQALPAVGKGGA